MDWFDLLAVQGTLKSLLQHYSIKTSILQWMDEWMDHWMDGWMDGWVDGWVGG